MTKKCRVRAKRFVEPCESLARITDVAGSFGKSKGIAEWNLIDMKTGRARRSYFGIRSKSYPNGFLFNFCPVCGTKIDAPFTDEASDVA